MLYIFLLFISLFQTPQQSSRNFELINTESGLSNNIVFDIYQDKEGFIWFATDNGLNRYDGYHFKKFYHDPADSTSLSSDITRKIIEDKRGNLWIGTKNGFNLYDRKNENFQRYSIKYDIKFPILSVRQVALDKNGKIWFSNLKEFGYFDTYTKECTIIESDFYAHSITMQADSVLWINSKLGELRFVKIKSSEYNKILNFKSSDNRQIHYGEYTNSLWLPKESLNQSLDVPVKIIPELPNGIKPFRLKEIDVHTLLIGSDNGLYEYNDKTKILKEVHLSKSQSALTKQIRSMYKDRNGGIWIGTLGGVFYYDSHKNNFNHVDLKENKADVVMGLQATSDGIYANALGEGLYYKSHTSNNFKKLQTEKSIADGELFIWGMKEVPESEYPLWMSTNTGLICYNPKKNKKKKIDLPVVKAGEELAFDIYNTQYNYVWVASMGSIHKVDKKSGALLETYVINKGKSTSIVQKIIEFDGRLILATESHGMHLLNRSTSRISPIMLKEGTEEKENISKTSIWDLHVFQNTLWIGTSRGLYKLESGDIEARPVFNNNQIVFSISNDQDEKLWLGTERGLISYDIRTEKARLYSQFDGLKNIEFNRRSVTKTKDGILWFGGVNGITFFDPTRIKANTLVPPVYITDIRVVTSEETFEVQHQNKQLVLPYKHNTIELNYVALNYASPKENQYRYQMIGHDPKWVDGQSRLARYVQLPSGKYTFQVIAANNDGLWNKVGDQIQIQILPPYWETWWFRLLIALIILTIIFTVYNYRVKQLLKIERMKLRIASDLHDEVGSGLSGIALTSDILEQQAQQGEVKPHLVTRINDKARSLAATLDDIVWLINPEKETLGDFIIKTKTIAREFLMHSDISFEEEISSMLKNRVLSSDLKRNLLFFVKEVINNIAKHAQAKKVLIRWEGIEKTIRLEITDDGRGFDPKEASMGHGITSIQNRAKEIGGSIDIQSEKEHGTTIVIFVKIP